MSSFLSQAGMFLVEVAFGFYLLVLLLRLLLQLARVDFYNPFSQFVVTLTSPPLRPLRRLIPGFFGIDWATVLLLVALKMVELWLVALLGGLATTAPALLFVLALVELVKLALYVYVVAILVRVVLSWVNPYGMRASPAGALLAGLTEPLLRPARRLIPPISGVDLSPIAVLVALQLLVMAVNHFGPTLFRLALGAP